MHEPRSMASRRRLAPWQGSGSETPKCNPQEREKEHSGSPCVTNLLVSCFSGPCSFDRQSNRNPSHSWPGMGDGLCL